MSSTAPVASAKDIAKHGWTAVPVDPKEIFGDRSYQHKPPPDSISDLPFPYNDPSSPKYTHTPEPIYQNLPTITQCECYCILKHQFPGQASVLSTSTWALSCLLHDIGTTPDNLRSTLLSFEWFGGILALDLLKSHGASQPQREAVAEAIIRHQDIGTVGKITFLGQLIQLATIFDNMGGRPELVGQKTRDEVVAKFPRLGWSGCFAKTIREENGLKPWAHTTHLGEEEFPNGVEGNQLMAPYEQQKDQREQG